MHKALFENIWIILFIKVDRCLEATRVNSKTSLGPNRWWIAKKNDPFLKPLVTGDKKWDTYDNVQRKRSCSNRGKPAHTMAKRGLEVRKVLLCVCGISMESSIISYSPTVEPLNQQIDCLTEGRIQRPAFASRREIMFHRNNFRRHTSIVTNEKRQELYWKVLMYSPYQKKLGTIDCASF